MDIEFHCDSEGNLISCANQVRAFLYTDYSIERHNHDFYEMNIILGGKGTHKIENMCFEVKEGDVFMIPPMIVHSYYNTDKLDVYHILLHKSFIDNNINESSSVPGFLQLVEIEPFLRRHFSNEMFLHLSRNQLIQLKADLDIICDNSKYSKETFVPLKIHTTWKILYSLSSMLYDQMFSSGKKAFNKYDMEIIKTLEYIHQNYSEKITIESLCRNSFLSRSTFLRSFSDVCGCTPIRYLTSYRCEKARKMIENTSLSKTEIANLCGFYDLSHMEWALRHKT